MKFLDSNILAHAFYKGPHKEACQQAIRQGGIINTFNLIEAYHIIKLQTNKEKARERIKSLLKSNLTILDVDKNMVFETLKRTKKYDLKFLDLVHYTCALLNNCSSILSYDKDFDGLELPREEP